MKKILVVLIVLVIACTACEKKPAEENITFIGVIDEVIDQSILVETTDEVGFDLASVNLSGIMDIGFNLQAGQKVRVTILPQIRESYPVQVTAIKIELLLDELTSDLGYQKITAAEAKAIIDKGEYSVILDVRTKTEYDEGHISGAVLLPDIQIAELAPTILPDKDSIILVYCRSGRRSEAASKKLVELGYTNVIDFGGIIDWPYEIVK